MNRCDTPLHPTTTAHLAAWTGLKTECVSLRPYNMTIPAEGDTEMHSDRWPLGFVAVRPTPDVPRGLLESTKRTFGTIPNVYRAMAHSPGLLATYIDGCDRFRAQSGFSPAEQEVVFLTISRENRCGYCMAAHSVIADIASNVPTAVTDAIRANHPIDEPRLQVLSQFTRIVLETGGRPGASDVEAFADAGFTEDKCSRSPSRSH